MAEVKVWDWADGREAASFSGHTGLVTAVAYFPDGRRLATVQRRPDHQAVGPADAARTVLTLRGHTSGVVGLAVSRDGRQIASGSIDYSARIWSIEAPEDEAAFELSLRRAAVERVQTLFARHLLKEDVLAELRDDRSLSPRLRAAALEIAERRTENASRLYEAAWLTIARPDRHPGGQRLALRRLEAAWRVAAEDPSRLAEYRQALALAQYRVGRAAEALETLRELAEAEARPAGDAGGPRRDGHGQPAARVATPRPARRSRSSGRWWSRARCPTTRMRSYSWRRRPRRQLRRRLARDPRTLPLGDAHPTLAHASSSTVDAGCRRSP